MVNIPGVSGFKRDLPGLNPHVGKLVALLMA
jgi:hypothetical protein